MDLNQLTKEEFFATMKPSISIAEFGKEKDKPFVDFEDYVAECIVELSLPTTREDIRIHYFADNEEKDLRHILLNWGKKNIYLVAIVKPEEGIIYGHYFLDLNKEYGLYGDDFQPSE